MLLGGPVLFLSGVDDIGECDDAWISIIYIVLTIIVYVVLMLLLNLRMCIVEAVRSASSIVDLYTRWPTVLFNVVAILQLVILESIVREGKELKGGPPWTVCGRDYKEFFFPRHKGLIFYCYAQIISFNFWILGCSIWSHELEVWGEADFDASVSVSSANKASVTPVDSGSGEVVGNTEAAS